MFSWCLCVLVVNPSAERVAAQTLPRGARFEWTDLTYQKILAGNAGSWVFPISLLLVFKGGQMARQKVGALPKHEIENLFKDLL